MADDKRTGPQPIGRLVPALVRPAFKRRAAATAQVLADWDMIVGPSIAAITTPLRLTSGTLSIGCAGPVALELQHLADALLGRINGHFGHLVVHRLRFVQSLHAPAPPATTAQIPAPVAAEAARAVADLPAGEVRDALERLGRAVLRNRPALTNGTVLTNAPSRDTAS